MSTQKEQILPVHPPQVNFMYLMMEAVAKDQNTLSQAQITDALSTKLSVDIEADIYQYWNGYSGPLEQDAGQVIDAANAGNNNEVAAWQAKYNADSAEAQSNESQEDGAVQAAQGQTSADASNLQMKAQMVQGVNSILTTLVNMLGRVTA